MMAASESDPIARIINGISPNAPAGVQDNEDPRNFEISLVDRIVFHGPIDYGRQNSKYINRKQY